MDKKSEAKHELKFHFVLVHGAGHCVWCWYKVASILRSKGQEVMTLDMAASGVNSMRIEELVSFEDFVRTLMEYLEGLHCDERVILVGHCLSGGVISIAMERFTEKILAAVFLAAYMPTPEIGLLAVAKTRLGMIDDFMNTKITPEEENHLKPLHWGFNFLASKDTSALSARGQSLYQIMDPMKLSDEKYGIVRRVFLVCQEDMLLKEDFQRWMIKKNTPDEMKVIEGAGHMAIMSKPCELACLLLDIARDFS